MSTITKEWLQKAISQHEALRDEIPFGLGEDDSNTLAALRIALASLEADPVAWMVKDIDTGEKIIRSDRSCFEGSCQPLYTAPPAPIVPDIQHSERLDWTLGQWASHLGGRHQNNDPTCYYEFGSFMAVAEMLRQFGNVQQKVGWNACRAAMLQAEPVSNSDELPLDYLQGHKDGLEWAAQLAEANHPQTGDWLYDDPIDLARAIRKGPDMPTVQGGNSPVIPDEVLSAIRKVARIRTDFDHFDGDRRGIGDCLDEAEQELIVTINKYASQLAAEPIATNDVREQQTAVPPIQADVAQAIENLKQKLVECNRYNYCADAVKNVEDACHAAMLQGSQPVSKREQVRREHAEWSDKTFGDVGPVGPLKHLSKEALEAAAEPDDLSEWADMQFLLWDAQRRAGISDGEITAAMEEKLKVNMARQWPEPKDGEPRQHLKPAPQTVPDSVISAAVNGIMANYADNAEDCREMVRTHVEQACRAAIQESGHG